MRTEVAQLAVIQDADHASAKHRMHRPAVISKLLRCKQIDARSLSPDHWLVSNR